MKTPLFPILFLLLFLMNTGYCQETPENRQAGIKLMYTDDLSDLTQKWIDSYSIAHPETEILKANLNNTEADILMPENSIGIISDKYFMDLKDYFNWKVLIGRDIIVPVVNTANPLFIQLINKGVSAEILAKFYTNPDWLWTSYEPENKTQMTPYLVADQYTQDIIASFMDVNKNAINARILETNEEVVEAVMENKYGIGFCKLSAIIDPGINKIRSGLAILPLDRNKDGKLDYFEEIYSNLNDFYRGVYIGKYPPTLVDNIYIVSSQVPENEASIDFIKWIITQGQPILDEYGYNELVLIEKQSRLDEVSSLHPQAITSKDENASSRALMYLILGIIAFIIILSVVINRIKARKMKIKGNILSGDGIISTTSFKLPKGLYFDKTYTWAFMEEDGTVRIGIDDFLQHITGRVSRIEMKDPGENITKSDPVIKLIQDGKQLTIYSPVSGNIKEINEELITDPSLLNKSPYMDGWIYKIEPSNWSRETMFMDMAEKHKIWLNAELSRLKEYFAKLLNAKSSSFSEVIMQDGGEISDSALQSLGPEEWEDFQKNFIDTSELR